jgi:hypothetical protein
MARTDTGMYGQYTGEMTDRGEYEDLLGGQSIMGGDAASEANMLDMLLGRGDQYSPEGLQAPPMFPEPRMDPQEFIRQQLAGDVVPMGRIPSEMQGVMGTFNQYPQAGSRGQETIQQFGGRQNPYLDLLNILRYPQGGQIRR